MTISSEHMAHVKAVQEKYIQDLMRKPHVVGVSVGRASSDANDPELALVVLVDKHVANDRLPPEDQIPSSLDGVRVIIRKTGGFTAV
ncbi:MAG: hypothetical protein K8J31_29070 [Anaerolineae bacterium]|nr:hypothetical protein [Anaerolineae bacterium]